MILLARVRAAPRLHHERASPPPSAAQPRGLTVGRGDGLLVVTLETEPGVAPTTRRQWQQTDRDGDKARAWSQRQEASFRPWAKRYVRSWSPLRRPEPQRDRAGIRDGANACVFQCSFRAGSPRVGSSLKGQ